MRSPLVTAIVSTYNAERFMRGCLEDLVSQTIFRDIEIIVIDSGSQQGEADICGEFANAHENIRYCRTSRREGLYEAWNRGIATAKGKYLTSANTDDRHSKDAFERLVGALDAQPHIALAYGDQLTSTVENETFDVCALRRTKVLRRPDFSPTALMLWCITGSQPMWRRTVHQEYGTFDPRFRIAGDYEFWMRIAQTWEFVHVPEPLGVFYDSPNTLSGRNNKWECDMECLRVRQTYLNREPWCNDRTLRPRLARELFGIGYQYVERYRNMTRARPFLLQAWRLDPFNTDFAKTLLLRGVVKSNVGLD